MVAKIISHFDGSNNIFADWTHWDNDLKLALACWRFTNFGNIFWPFLAWEFMIWLLINYGRTEGSGHWTVRSSFIKYLQNNISNSLINRLRSHMLWRDCVIFLNFRFSDLVTTLTYVLVFFLDSVNNFTHYKYVIKIKIFIGCLGGQRPTSAKYRRRFKI